MMMNRSWVSSLRKIPGSVALLTFLYSEYWYYSAHVRGVVIQKVLLVEGVLEYYVAAAGNCCEKISVKDNYFNTII